MKKLLDLWELLVYYLRIMITVVITAIDDISDTELSAVKGQGDLDAASSWKRE